MESLPPNGWKWNHCHLVERVSLHVCKCYHSHLVEISLTTHMWGLSLSPVGEKLNYMYVRAMPPGGEKLNCLYVRLSLPSGEELELNVCEGYHCHLVERSFTTYMWGLSLPTGGEMLTYMYVSAITAIWWREIELHVWEGYHYHLGWRVVELHVCESYPCHLVERRLNSMYSMWGLSLPPGGEKLNYMYVRAITVTQWREVELHVWEGYHYHLGWRVVELHVCESYPCHLVERRLNSMYSMWVLSLPPGGEKLNYMYVRAITAPWRREVDMCECQNCHLVERNGIVLRLITAIWRIKREMCALITAT